MKPATRLSFAELLGLAFIVLKLIEEIDWSWGWVLAPLWIRAIFLVLVALGEKETK